MYYRTRGNLTEVGLVQSASACGVLCNTAPGCGAWTWGKARAREGLSDVCFLKRLAKGEWPQKLAQDGVISGYACRSASGFNSALSAVVSAAMPQRLAHDGAGVGAADVATPRGVDFAATPARVAVEDVSDSPSVMPTPSKVGAAAAPGSAAAPGAAASVGARAVAPGGVGAAAAPGGGGARPAVQGGASDHRATGPAAASSAQARGVQSSVYCFQLMQPAGYELELVAYQFEKRASIFACDRWTLFSSKAIKVSLGFRTTPIKSDLRCETGGEFGTVLNTEIFMAVWAEVINVGEFERASWTVKVDPDCVFLPARLLPRLQGLEDEPGGVYLNNCALGMRGPLEVLSRNAVLAWAGGAERCERRFQRLCGGPCQWGEDKFVDQCLWKVLGVRRVDDWDLLLEAKRAPRRGGTSCRDPKFAGFHPFRSPSDWWRCHQDAVRASNVTAS